MVGCFLGGMGGSTLLSDNANRGGGCSGALDAGDDGVCLLGNGRDVGLSSLSIVVLALLGSSSPTRSIANTKLPFLFSKILNLAFSPFIILLHTSSSSSSSLALPTKDSGVCPALFVKFLSA